MGISAKEGYTYKDYLKLECDRRYEILDGKFVMVPAPGIEHQRIVRRILIKLDLFVNEKGLG